MAGSAQQHTKQTRRPGRPMSRRRKWAFRIVAMTAVPALFFCLLELGLRIGGYGYETDFFVKSSSRDAYVTNSRYGWRFFGPSIARAPVAASLTAGKQAGTCRIFVLGGSAAQGYPDPSFSFGRILHVMLSQTYRATKFEVVNAAMTAVNSHIVRLIAKDCAQFSPSSRTV